MTPMQDAGSCLEAVANSARRRRELFVANYPSIAERLDQPVKTRQGRGMLGAMAHLKIGTGLEDALGEDWFSHEAWGAWSALERSVLRLALTDDVALPARLRLDVCAVIAEGQVRRIRVLSSDRVAGALDYVRPDSVVAMTIEITDTDLGAARALDLIIEIDGLITPATTVGGGDSRLLGAGLVQVCLLGAAEDGRRGLAFQGRRVINILRRARMRLRDRGLARGALHLARAAWRRLF